MDHQMFISNIEESNINAMHTSNAHGQNPMDTQNTQALNPTYDQNPNQNLNPMYTPNSHGQNPKSMQNTQVPNQLYDLNPNQDLTPMTTPNTLDPNPMYMSNTQEQNPEYHFSNPMYASDIQDSNPMNTPNALDTYLEHPQSAVNPSYNQLQEADINAESALIKTHATTRLNNNKGTANVEDDSYIHPSSSSHQEDDENGDNNTTSTRCNHGANADDDMGMEPYAVAYMCRDDITSKETGSEGTQPKDPSQKTENVSSNNAHSPAAKQDVTRTSMTLKQFDANRLTMLHGRLTTGLARTHAGHRHCRYARTGDDGLGQSLSPYCYLLIESVLFYQQLTTPVGSIRTKSSANMSTQQTTMTLNTTGTKPEAITNDGVKPRSSNHTDNMLSSSRRTSSKISTHKTMVPFDTTRTEPLVITSGAVTPTPSITSGAVTPTPSITSGAVTPTPSITSGAVTPTPSITTGYKSKISFGGTGKGRGEFSGMNYGVAVSADDEIFVTDLHNKRIQVFNMNGVLLRIFPTVVQSGKVQKRLYPTGVAVDKKGNVWVAGKCKVNRGNNVHVYNRDGDLVRRFGDFGSGKGRLFVPRGVHVCTDGIGNIIVANSRNNRVDMFTSRGEFVRTVVNTAEPKGVAFSSDGHLVEFQTLME
ncbi:hypothetical protein Bbelb_374100 [Branchiostoma belcheri]|nr:hypothetical protein Bbelb_374100 [Branchiostoma belcheri]